MRQTDSRAVRMYLYVHICTLYLHVHRAVIGFLHLALGHVFESSKAKRVEGPRGHSTTTWTKFYPILTPSPLEGTNMDILHILSTLYHMNPVDFLLTPFTLFLSTQLLNAPQAEASQGPESKFSQEHLLFLSYDGNTGII